MSLMKAMLLAVVSATLLLVFHSSPSRRRRHLDRGRESRRHPRAGQGRLAEKSEFLSEGQWLCVLLTPEEVEKSLPAGGLKFTYPFQIAEAGKRAVWARIGFEFARSPVRLAHRRRRLEDRRRRTS